MDKNQLQQSINKMKKELAEMEAKLKCKVPKPSEDNYGWLLSGDGYVVRSVWLSFTKDYFKMGNWFPTEQEAIKARDRQLALTRVKHALLEHKVDWEADWSDHNSAKSAIYYSHIHNCFSLSFEWSVQTANSNLYSTKDACQWVIDNMKDDLKLIFEVD